MTAWDMMGGLSQHRQQEPQVSQHGCFERNVERDTERDILSSNAKCDMM